SSNNRWSSDAYPGSYRDDVNRSIGFSGLGMDMFARGRVVDTLDILRAQAGMAESQVSSLDIGCGVGVSHPLLAPHVGSLHGVDVSAEAIEDARLSNADIEYSVQEDSRLPFEDSTFDFCSTTCVMHHVPPDQWPSFVAEAWRVTRPGGLFAVYEHNPINPMTRWAVWRCPFDHDAVLLRASRVRELLRNQGFEIVTQRYLFFLPLDRPWARRFDRLLRWLPLGAQYVVCARRPANASARVQHPA
ncbi:class I SAM-dependent methyltransferase, partial [Dokdonella sp.]|uniref:class I SAM-dependent methyltransferase n=1 Tax=Dokdonella sp. TaxID=2291710 RepID=UPI003C3DE002